MTDDHDRSGSRIIRLSGFALFWLVMVVILFPFVEMISTSLKSPQDYSTYPPVWFPSVDDVGGSALRGAVSGRNRARRQQLEVGAYLRSMHSNQQAEPPETLPPARLGWPDANPPSASDSTQYCAKITE